MTNHDWSQHGTEHVPADLAAIVLAAPPRRRAYDAQNVLLLALVIALLAAFAAWVVSLTRDDAPAAPAARSSALAGPPAPDAAAPAPAAAAAAAAQPRRPAAAVEGVQLIPTRVTGAPTASGGAVLRTTIANRGTEPVASEAAVQVSALVDGALVGSAPLGQVDAGASVTVELVLERCPVGRPSVVAVVDPRGVQRETNERDNARSTTVAFGC